MKVDLHIHTTASDGSWTPVELLQQVQQTGIGLFAVTDHDSIGSVKETARLAEMAGIGFIAGVEICSTLSGQCFHILGYGIDPDSPVLTKLLHTNTELMEQADEDSVKKLAAQGEPISYEDYLAYCHNPARGGWKSLSYFTDKGLCANVGEFFSRLFTAKRGIVFPGFSPPREVIAAIHAAGGKAVLAHPGSDFHGTMLEETLDAFAAEAIDGIECYHPSQDVETSRRAFQWCERRGLLVTGGSDCHGAFVPERRLGVPEIQFSQLRLENLVNK